MEKDDRTGEIAEHFEQEAAEYDRTFLRIIPRYREMLEALAAVLPFPDGGTFSAIDLGCGTGNVSRMVLDRYPGAEMTCVDFAPKMLEMARKKLGDGVAFIQADLNSFDFPRRYDAVVSSLALHHFADDAAKLNFYRKIHAGLVPGGVFVNADIVLGSDPGLQQLYMRKWREFMLETIPEEEVDGKWLVNHRGGDRPAKLMTHLAMLGECGFTDIDVVYKYYNYTVYTARAFSETNDPLLRFPA